MPKPACVKCQRFFRPHRNGVWVLEGKPAFNGAQPGTSDADNWKPYKMWIADLWRCEGCGTEIIYGYGHNPVMQDFRNDPETMREVATHRVNDC